jgi:hypothetical protein
MEAFESFLNQQEVSQEQDLQPLNNDTHGEKKTVHGMSNDVKSQQQQLPRSNFGTNHPHKKGNFHVFHLIIESDN